MISGRRWPVEECHQQATGQTGLDQHQVRLWHSFHRHTMLSLSALAILAVAAARPAPPAPLAQRGDAPASAGTQPCGLGAHRDPPGQPRRATPRRPRPGQGQRPRSPPPAAPGHHADDRRRPPARLLLVPLAATTPGPRPLPPLPDPAPGSTHITSQPITNRDCSTRASGPHTILICMMRCALC